MVFADGRMKGKIAYQIRSFSEEFFPGFKI